MISKLITLFLLVASASAHMEMANPPARRSQYSKYYQDHDMVDWDNDAPLDPNQGRPFPCRGFPEGPAEVTLKAGEPFTIKLRGSATHGGGHCQFALKYRVNGRDTPFVVFNTVMEKCPLNYDYTMTLPATAPGGKAVLAWTWVNAVGNREYYMNCADVNIVGPTQSCMAGKELFVCNYPGYPTIPEFALDPEHGRHYFNERKDTQLCVGKQKTSVKGQKSPSEHDKPSKPRRPQRPTPKQRHTHAAQEKDE
ncbi:uncharacterized protein VTP21DRAFT_59 [Calcarisporiella thermophila]|uniref:uncharacterized protein n=1 Tax=Calcarisporiella thermophila TaxID=911321 RepID=UPI0037433A30